MLPRPTARGPAGSRFRRDAHFDAHRGAHHGAQSRRGLRSYLRGMGALRRVAAVSYSCALCRCAAHPRWRSPDSNAMESERSAHSGAVPTSHQQCRERSALVGGDVASTWTRTNECGSCPRRCARVPRTCEHTGGRVVASPAAPSLQPSVAAATPARPSRSALALALLRGRDAHARPLTVRSSSALCVAVRTRVPYMRATERPVRQVLRP